jgi:hypothetical protein
LIVNEFIWDVLKWVQKQMVAFVCYEGEDEKRREEKRKERILSLWENIPSLGIGLRCLHRKLHIN